MSLESHPNGVRMKKKRLKRAFRFVDYICHL
nr:MAG TPA: hypothetical protein [Caudoviricetes sp.]